MKISGRSRDIIVKEIEFVVERMGEVESAQEKIYYFSGIHSMFQRLINIEYDSDLLYAFVILKETYTAISSRINAIEKAGDHLVPLTEFHFLMLSELAVGLAKQIADKKSIASTLKKFVILAYSTTGNGYYLMQKGVLKI